MNELPKGAVIDPIVDDSLPAGAVLDPDKYSAADIQMLNTSYDKGGADYVPKWGQDNPNVYAAVMSGLDALPIAASAVPKLGWGIPIAGALNVAGQQGKRTIQGEGTDGFTVLKDLIKGMGVEGAGRGLVGILKYGLNSLPNTLTRSAAKMSTGLTPAEQKAMADTLLKYGTTFDEQGGRGLESILERNLITKNALIDAADKSGVVFKNADIINTVTDPLATDTGSLAKLLAYGNKVDASVPNYSADVINTVKQFAKGGDMTPSTLVANQRAKGDLLKKAWGENTVNDAVTQTDKQLYANIGKIINDNIDGIAPLNANSKEVLDVLPYLNKSANRIGNRDVIGLRETLGLSDSLMPSQFAENPTTATGKLFAYLMDRPQIKSAIARNIYKAANANIAGKTLSATVSALDRPVRGAFDAAVFGTVNHGR